MQLASSHSILFPVSSPNAASTNIVSIPVHLQVKVDEPDHEFHARPVPKFLSVPR